MRNRVLHDALRDFALEAAAHLSAELKAGAEIAFDVIEEPGGGTILYRYQPLTADFIGARWDALRELPAFRPAADALGSGAQTYLRVQTGSPATDDSEPALRAMLERLYEDATGFEYPEERFERVYAEVERTLFANTIRTAVVAPLHGIEMERERVDLGDGLFLIAGDRIEAPPGAVWSDATGHVAQGREPNVLCVLRRDVAVEDPLPISEARVRFKKLLTALRLFKAGGLSLGPLAFGRVDEGAWQPLPLGASGVARGGPWVLEPAEQPELAELVELVAAAKPTGRTAWALTRFELGCERVLDTEALSDYLLALGSLLDATDEAGRASLTLRLAALCAEEGERKPLQRRVELAYALERWVMGGGGANGYLEALGPDTPRSLVLDLEQHLRALLRDVLCGYLGPDLKAGADDVLLASSEPIEIRAEDLRKAGKQESGGQGVEPEAESGEAEKQPAELESEAEPELVEQPVVEEPEVEEPEAVEQPELLEDEEADDPGVTPSADWEHDDDPASYSAPI